MKMENWLDYTKRFKSKYSDKHLSQC